MIVVAVGTHEYPFDRLIRATARLAGTLRVQRGTSRIDVPGAEVVDLLPPSALQRWVAEADLVITHGGPGTIRLALAAGKVPLVVPRRRAFGEHVDDHQVAFARRMADRVHLVEDPSTLPDAVARHADVARGLRPPSVQARQEAFADALGRLITGLVGDR